MKPLILELGMGADVHGHDQTKAALRAVSDAIRHSSLTVFHSHGHPSGMMVQVTIGVPHPEQVDKAEVAAALPFGTVTVDVVAGGLDDCGMGGQEDITLAVAAIAAWFDTSGHPFVIAV
jgi:uncharacterized protein (TIGR02058 family)